MCYQQGMVEGDVLPRPCTCGILKGGKVFSVPFEGFQDIYDEYFKLQSIPDLIDVLVKRNAPITEIIVCLLDELSVAKCPFK